MVKEIQYQLALYHPLLLAHACRVCKDSHMVKEIQYQLALYHPNNQ
jgi:hypothetical protein